MAPGPLALSPVRPKPLVLWAKERVQGPGTKGFWLHRYLVSKEVENLVVDSASIEVSPFDGPLVLWPRDKGLRAGSGEADDDADSL